MTSVNSTSEFAQAVCSALSLPSEAALRGESSQLVLLGTRAGRENAQARPGRLEFAPDAEHPLGTDVESHVTVSGNNIQVWLAAAESLIPGRTIALGALTSDDSAIFATAVVPDFAPARLSFELKWPEAELPEKLEYVVLPDAA